MKGKGERPTSILTSGDSAERESRPPSYHEQDPAAQPADPFPQSASNMGTLGGNAATYALRVMNASETEVSEVRVASRAATFASDEELPDVETASRTATVGHVDEADQL